MLIITIIILILIIMIILMIIMIILIIIMIILIIIMIIIILFEALSKKSLSIGLELNADDKSVSEILICMETHTISGKQIEIDVQLKAEFL